MRVLAIAFVMSLAVFVAMVLLSRGPQLLDAPLSEATYPPSQPTINQQTTPPPTPSGAHNTHESPDSSEPLPPHTHEPLPRTALPIGIQRDIQRFNSNDNKQLVVKSEGNGLYSASMVGIHQAVPVAVIEHDGSVTIAEY